MTESATSDTMVKGNLSEEVIFEQGPGNEEQVIQIYGGREYHSRESG